MSLQIKDQLDIIYAHEWKKSKIHILGLSVKKFQHFNS